MTVILICIGSLLVILNILAINKEKKSFSKTLNNAEMNVTDIDLKIGGLRKEFAETLLELQKEIRDLQLKVEELEEEKLPIKELKNEEIELDSVSTDYEHRLNSNERNTDEIVEKPQEFLVNERVYKNKHKSNAYTKNSKLYELVDDPIYNTKDSLEISGNEKANKGKDLKGEIQKDTLEIGSSTDLIHKNEMGEDIEKEEVQKEKAEKEVKEVKLRNTNNNIKIKEIEKYINKGISIDEIAEILNIGKGEVLLIKELYIK